MFSKMKRQSVCTVKTETNCNKMNINKSEKTSFLYVHPSGRNLLHNKSVLINHPMNLKKKYKKMKKYKKKI